MLPMFQAASYDSARRFGSPPRTGARANNAFPYGVKRYYTRAYHAVV